MLIFYVLRQIAEAATDRSVHSQHFLDHCVEVFPTEEAQRLDRTRRASAYSLPESFSGDGLSGIGEGDCCFIQKAPSHVRIARDNERQ